MNLDFTGVNLPFNVGDLLGATMDFIGVFGPFILLGLAVFFAPRIITFFKGALGRRKEI